jgi:hypothetical protein
LQPYHFQFSSIVCREQLYNGITKTFSDEVWTSVIRELRHVENFNCSIEAKHILDFFRCRRCNAYPTQRPVWQCRAGHIQCNECITSNLFPPLCKVCNFRTDYRFIFAERSLSQISKACRFEKNGCKVKITENNCKHEKDECWFRETCCIYFRCRKEMQMIQIFNHLKECHLDQLSYNLPVGTSFGNILKEAQGFFNIPDLRLEQSFSGPSWNEVRYLKTDEESYFFFECWLTNSSKQCFLWVYFLGPPVAAKQFAFRLRLFNPESKREIHFSGPVISVATEMIFAMIRPIAIMLTLDEICNFWSLDHPKFFWQLIVFKKTLISEFNQYNRIYFSRSAECMNQEQITKM